MSQIRKMRLDEVRPAAAHVPIYGYAPGRCGGESQDGNDGRLLEILSASIRLVSVLCVIPNNEKKAQKTC